VRIRLEDLRFPPNVSAGMNYLELASLAYRLRATTEEVEPIRVQALADGTYRIEDGRHRVVAHLIAGRPDVPAVVSRSAQTRTGS
jgi:hypothetical protein